MISFGVADARVQEKVDLKNNVELARSVSDKHLDLLRPSARNYSIFRGNNINYMSIYLVTKSLFLLTLLFVSECSFIIYFHDLLYSNLYIKLDLLESKD